MDALEMDLLAGELDSLGAVLEEERFRHVAGLEPEPALARLFAAHSRAAHRETVKALREQGEEALALRVASLRAERVQAEDEEAWRAADAKASARGPDGPAPLAALEARAPPRAGPRAAARARARGGRGARRASRRSASAPSRRAPARGPRSGSRPTGAPWSRATRRSPRPTTPIATCSRSPRDVRWASRPTPRETSPAPISSTSSRRRATTASSARACSRSR